MTQDIARRTARISLSFVVLVVALGCDTRSPFAPPPPPTPATKYNLSGIVTDNNGSPVANAQLALHYEIKSATTSTDASGRYSISFETSWTAFHGNVGIVGAIFYMGGGDFENYHVQAVPSGTADVVKHLRLRRVRTLNAGESTIISIDADSSVAYDGEDWLIMGWVWEKLHVRVAEAGILTVEARPPSGGVAPQLGILCRLVIDNCASEFVERPRVPWRQSRYVNANSLFEIRVAIPSAMAPQPYEVVTSRQ
jgi:hypothetical protein